MSNRYTAQRSNPINDNDQNTGHFSKDRWAKDSSVGAKLERFSGPTRERNRDYKDIVPTNDEPKMGSYAEQILKDREEMNKKKLEKKLESEMTEEQLLEKQLGFSSFGSTKGKHVRGANPFYARVDKKRKYTQYLNKKKWGKRGNNNDGKKSNQTVG
jgi:hypothetical protein